jgi:hypothetical protein
MTLSHRNVKVIIEALFVSNLLLAELNSYSLLELYLFKDIVSQDCSPLVFSSEHPPETPS